MQQESKFKLFVQHSSAFITVMVLLLSVILFYVPASAEEMDTVHTVSGQELPEDIQEPEQEEREDDKSNVPGNNELYYPEVDPVSGMDDNFYCEENEMINSLLMRLDRLIDLLTTEEPESVSVSEDTNIMYPHGYQDWPYPVRVHYSILTCEGYATESAAYCASPAEFEESFRGNVQSIAEGSLKTFLVQYVLSLDEDSAPGELVYDYANPVYLAVGETEGGEDDVDKELYFEGLLSYVKSIDEKLSDMQEENQQLTVSGNDLISNLDDTIQKGNEENRQMITDLFTQGTTYILAFIGIVVGAIIGSILSRYLKHD